MIYEDDKLRAEKMRHYRESKRQLAAADKLIKSVGTGHPRLTKDERQRYNDHMASYKAHADMAEQLAIQIANIINRR